MTNAPSWITAGSFATLAGAAVFYIAASWSEESELVLFSNSGQANPHSRQCDTPSTPENVSHNLALMEVIAIEDGAIMGYARNDDGSFSVMVVVPPIICFDAARTIEQPPEPVLTAFAKLDECETQRISAAECELT